MFHSQNIECSEFRPLQDYVILAPKIEKERKVKGIILPPDKTQFGRCPVIAAGPDSDLKQGDVVWMQKFVEGELKFVLNGVPVYAIRSRRINVTIKANKLRPAGDRILVQRIETQPAMRGGIHIPKSAQESSQECEVVGVGPKVKSAMSPGDRILISKYGGTEVPQGDIKLTIINENDIVGVLSK